ncbi:E3 ubiquitin-protein ligase lrsam1 [Balamuthia mandrillaris]
MRGSREEEAARGESRRSAFLRLAKDVERLRLQNLKLRAQLRRSERQRDEVERLLSLALTPEPETGREASRRATKEHVECVLCLADAEESPLQRVVFLPCGHLCCCLSCGEPLRRCPLCRATIEQQVLVFLP